MANRYNTTEIIMLESFLKKVPRNVNGILPYSEWENTSEWKSLISKHPVNSLKQKLLKMWKESVIPINPPVSIPQSQTQLNHAYNFCPGCGMKLN